MQKSFVVLSSFISFDWTATFYRDDHLLISKIENCWNAVWAAIDDNQIKVRLLVFQKGVKMKTKKFSPSKSFKCDSQMELNALHYDVPSDEQFDVCIHKINAFDCNSFIEAKIICPNLNRSGEYHFGFLKWFGTKTAS